MTLIAENTIKYQVPIGLGTWSPSVSYLQGISLLRKCNIIASIWIYVCPHVHVTVLHVCAHVYLYVHMCTLYACYCI